MSTELLNEAKLIANAVKLKAKEAAQLCEYILDCDDEDEKQASLTELLRLIEDIEEEL